MCVWGGGGSEVLGDTCILYMIVPDPPRGVFTFNMILREFVLL